MGSVRAALSAGYTEISEERVRSLEAVVKELMALLAAKNEKIDTLSKAHANRKACTPSSSPSPPADIPKESRANKSELALAVCTEVYLHVITIAKHLLTGCPLLDSMPGVL